MSDRLPEIASLDCSDANFTTACNAMPWTLRLGFGSTSKGGGTNV